ncbi:MAG: DUF4231 domain-containing protein [Chloroflexi bacterium]|nr:DUF4231 domain-containing protein [Chloroflexota bacterium]
MSTPVVPPTSDDSTPPASGPPSPPPTRSETRTPPGEPLTQSQDKQQDRRPDWLKEMPNLSGLPRAEKDFQLIDEKDLRETLAEFDEATIQKVLSDIQFMEYELVRLFRMTDRKAAENQNRYLVYQLGFISLAAVAAGVGALQALSVGRSDAAVAAFALIETIVALIATYLATISGREAPLPIWLENRRRAEHLRREFFRYMLHLAPYDMYDRDNLPEYLRERELARRAAEINRGSYPDEPQTLASPPRS